MNRPIDPTRLVGVAANSVAPISSAHLPVLDGVRGLAVAIVIIHNAAWVVGDSPRFLTKLVSAIAATGWVGVQLFFVLSGFLITGILLDSKGRPRFFSSFYARRTLRIFPLYYGFLAVALLVAPWLSWSAPWIASVQRDQWPYWLYLSSWTDPFRPGIEGLGHLWSLSVEEQFYLAWPFLVWSLTRRGLVRLCTVMIVITPFLRLVLRSIEVPELTAYTFPIARWDALAIGALIAALMRDDAGRMMLSAWSGRVTALALGCLALQVGVVHGLNAEGFWGQVTGQSLVAILSASLIVFAVNGPASAPSVIQRLLSRRWLCTLGKYSYAMYVLHMPLHHLLMLPLGDWVRMDDTPWRLARLAVYLMLVLVGSFVAALISWRLIEKPFLDLKERVAPRP